MATASGEASFDVNDASLRALMEDEPFRFQFFQMVRLLNRMKRERKVVGGFEQPDSEVARFAVHQALWFSPCEIDSVVWADESLPMPLVRVNFMGLTGPQGALPLVYSQEVIDRVQSGDKGFRDFLDIFNHRIISHFYRAWEKYRFPVGFERGESDPLTTQLMALVGLGLEQLQGRQQVSDTALLCYAGLISQKPHSAGGLEQIISDYFDVPVEIDQFIGAWFQLGRESQTCLADSGEYTEQLGVGAVLGDEVWEQQYKVRIRIGPLPFDRYVKFLPKGDRAAQAAVGQDGAEAPPRGHAFEQLKSLVRFYQDSEVDFELQLILKRDEIRVCQLGGTGSSAAHLGWISWVQPSTTDGAMLDSGLSRDAIIPL